MQSDKYYSNIADKNVMRQFDLEMTYRECSQVPVFYFDYHNTTGGCGHAVLCHGVGRSCSCSCPGSCSMCIPRLNCKGSRQAGTISQMHAVRPVACSTMCQPIHIQRHSVGGLTQALRPSE